jgi:hypothetical protein
LTRHNSSVLLQTEKSVEPFGPISDSTWKGMKLRADRADLPRTLMPVAALRVARAPAGFCARRFHDTSAQITHKAAPLERTGKVE